MAKVAGTKDKGKNKVTMGQENIYKGRKTGMDKVPGRLAWLKLEKYWYS